MPRETHAQRQARMVKLLAKFKKMYPDAACALHHRNPLQLLIATILSAQCTDVRVNMVTPELFRRFPDAKSLAEAPLPEIEKLIQSTGFFHSKAKALKQSAADIVEKHAGEVPQTMEELIALRGVGRKTANVVLGNAFGKNVGIVVDTHVGRLSHRLGLTRHGDPKKIEQDLMALIPQKDWALWSHLLIFHGRQVCFARKPNCVGCAVSSLCPSAFTFDKTMQRAKTRRGT